MHYRDLDKEQEAIIKDINLENEGLKDDAYVLRRALLNTKSKQKALERQLEEIRSQNLELITTNNNLNLQLREQIIKNQKDQILTVALADENVFQQQQQSKS